MGTSLAIWKWERRGTDAQALRIYNAIGGNRKTIERLQPFDAKDLQGTIRRRFRDGRVATFEISPGGTKRYPWLHLTASFASAYLALPKLVRLLKPLGLTLFIADEGRIVDAALAKEYATEAMRQLGLEAKRGHESRRRHDQLVRRYFVPAARKLGFVRRKPERKGCPVPFVREENDRRCVLRIVQAWDDDLELHAEITYLQLLKGRKPRGRFAHLDEPLATPHPPHRTMSWSTSPELDLAKVGKSLATFVTRYAWRYFDYYKTVEDYMAEEEPEKPVL
jgi:hypothetical protein